ncbi:MAG: alpha/beta hydrolase-fold protein [Pseudohongiella sp.]|nr:alpha/beta hydrolase-fold protein [Pseudohongiella sp.]
MLKCRLQHLFSVRLLLLHSIASLALLCLLIWPSAAMARDRVKEVVLDDGSTVKVFLFVPENSGDGPWPLCVLMSGGSGNEYVARAQFWLGRELSEHGWMIAVPVSPNNEPFTGANGLKIPKVISILQQESDILPGKALLVGVSTGGSSALELAAQNPDQYQGVVAVPGMIKDTSIIGEMGGLPVYLRIGEDDVFRWDDRMPALVAALEAGNAKVDARVIKGGKHIFRLDWNELEPWLNSLHNPMPADENQ